MVTSQGEVRREMVTRFRENTAVELAFYESEIYRNNSE